MSMMQEFKDFAVKGNAIDLAVGVIVGAAFGKIVDSIVGGAIPRPFIAAVAKGVEEALVAGRRDERLEGLERSAGRNGHGLGEGRAEVDAGVPEAHRGALSPVRSRGAAGVGVRGSG